MKEYVLETNALTKRYGNFKAVDHMSIEVEKGAIYGLIGRNGAGKTTFMKMVTGLAEATEGEIILFDQKGRPIAESQRRIGLLIENAGVFGDMTAFENMKAKAIGMGVYDKERIQEILNEVGLGDVGRKKVKKFSLGMKQRLGIGLALVGSPDLLILDEPINGLDPQGIIEMRQLIEKLNKERRITFIISSHILEELYKIVTHVAIIDKGQLIAQMSKEELDRSCAKRIAIITPQPDRATVVLEHMGINQYTVVSKDTVYVYGETERSQEIVRELVKNDISVTEIRNQNENLEEFFINLTEAV